MKNHTGLLLLCLVAPFWLLGQANTLSKNNSRATLEWFKDAGLGLRIHWGLESQLGISMGQSLVNASPAFQERFFTVLPKSFNPQHFEPRELANLAKLAGVQYILFTVKDEAGFCLWPTETTAFNIANTPYGKDLVKEHIEAVRAAGLKVGIQYATEDYHFLHAHDLPIRTTWDEELDEELQESYEGYIEAQIQELFSNYGKIEMLFLEGNKAEFAAKVAKELQKDILITGGALSSLAEHIPAQANNKGWEVSFSMADQWSYKARPAARSTSGLIELLIETRTKGGTALFTMGLQPDGSLPQEEKRSLQEMAAWSFINNEAIQDIRPWVLHQEGELWLARKREATDVYVYISPKGHWPIGEERSFILRSVRTTKDSEISLLGQAMEIPGVPNPPIGFTQEAGQLQIQCTRWHQIYDNGRWPNPAVLKITRAEPTLHSPVVQTLPPQSQGENLHLKGFLAGKGDQNELQLGFEYRSAPALFSDASIEWTRSDWVESTANGHFKWPLKGLPTGEYEVRAIVKNEVLKVPGDILRFSIP